MVATFWIVAVDGATVILVMLNEVTGFTGVAALALALALALLSSIPS